MKIFLSALENGSTCYETGKPLSEFIVESGVKMKWNLMSYYYLRSEKAYKVGEFIRDNSELVMKKYFGKTGIFLWIGLSTLLANVQVVKSVEVFGVSSALGNVLFASVFLATDLLRECYGKEEAKKGVYIGISSVIIFFLFTQLTLLYIPNDIDMSHSAMQTVFAMSPRICGASLAMYAISNLVAVTIYDKLHRMCDGKMMWLRNNVATITCNCAENFGFAFLAFGGIYSVEDIIMIAASGCLIEAGIAICDTPFLYIGKKL